MVVTSRFPISHINLLKMLQKSSKEGVMARIAFLKILEHEGIIPNIEEIHDWLLRRASEYNFKVYTEIRPFEEYIPRKDENAEHRLVVWRFHRDDTVSDEEILNLAGHEGYVLYVWLCPRCKSFCRRAEHPRNRNDDLYFGCSCPESVFYGGFML